MSNGARERSLTIPERARDLAVTGGQQIMSGLEWWLLRSSEIPTTPFLDRGDFPWADTLEKHWHDVRAELDAVLERREDLPNFQDILRDVAPISRDDRWKAFFFFAYGYRSDANCASCPHTAALLDTIPGVVTAFFSILSPHKHIPPHRGALPGRRALPPRPDGA